jgi:hypothetical protein
VLGVASKPDLYFVSVTVNLELRYIYSDNKRVLPLNFNEFATFGVSPSGLVTTKALVNINYFVRFEILNPSTMKITVFWNVTMYSCLETYRRFGKKFCIHLQEEKARS